MSYKACQVAGYQSETGGKRRKVLIADDTEDNRLVLRDLLEPLGFDIRGIPEIRGVPVIAVSANVFETDREKSRTAGCQEFLPKPVKPDRLFALMKKYMKLEWIYEEAVSGVSLSLSEGEIIPPPPDELGVLYELTMFGDLRRVREEVRQLEETDAKYAPFARKVCGYAEDFEDEPILELLEGFMKAGS